MFDFLNTIELKYIIWTIPIVMLFHELEEWNILKWYKDNYIELPSSTNRSIRIWLIGISLVGFIWTGICYLVPIPSLSAILISLLIAVTLQNGIQHLYWLVYFKRYAPGVIFSVLFGIPADAYISYRIVAEGLAPLWVLLLVELLIIPGLIETIKAGNRMTKSIRGAHELGIKIEKKICG